MNKNILGLYSKYPEFSGFPKYYDKCKGVYVWSNGKKYMDFSYMGMSCLLGYGNKAVDKAVKKAIKKGVQSSLNNPDEEILAKMLTDKFMPDGKVRFARTGGESIWIACKLANPGNKVILRQGYNGHIVESMNCKKFNYNDIESFNKQFDNDVGCVIVEHWRYKQPDYKFFMEIVLKCRDKNIPIILDCISSGFREKNTFYYEEFFKWFDFIVVGKCLGNGYAIGAVIGKEKYMDNNAVFVSSNNFTETIGTSAAIATLKELEKYDYSRLIYLGGHISGMWKFYADKYGIEISVNEVPQLSHFEFIGEYRKEYRTIFVNIMLEHGILGNTSFYPCYKHTNAMMKKYAVACEDAFLTIDMHRALSDMYCKNMGWEIIQDRPIVIK